MGKFLLMIRQLEERQHQNTSVVSEAAARINDSNSRAKSALSAKSSNEKELLDAGWTPKWRSGQTMWGSPTTGFWYAGEVALTIVRGEQLIETYLQQPPEDLGDS